jgi:hypothetical protein
MSIGPLAPARSCTSATRLTSVSRCARAAVERLPEALVRSERGGERRRRDERGVAGGARGGLVRVDGVRIAERLGEAADLALLHVDDDGIALPSDERSIEHRFP